MDYAKACVIVTENDAHDIGTLIKLREELINVCDYRDLPEAHQFLKAMNTIISEWRSIVDGDKK